MTVVYQYSVKWKKAFDLELLAQLYSNKELSIRQIAKQLGWSRSTVMRNLKFLD